jgi:hypothetical protein
VGSGKQLLYERQLLTAVVAGDKGRFLLQNKLFFSISVHPAFGRTIDFPRLGYISNNPVEQT